MVNRFMPFAALALFVACGTEDAPEKPIADGADLVVDVGKADHGGAAWRGALASGVTEEAALSRREPYHVWSWQQLAAAPVFIDLASREGGDTYLLLYRQTERGYRLVAQNDDCRDTLNSCLEARLEAGEYAIVASSYPYIGRRRRTALSYHLTVWQTCGTRGAGPCAGSHFCDHEERDACGALDMGGVCAPRPDVCTREFRPVCGCDGQTYSNACEARAGGTDVASEGACERDGQGVGELCGGIAGLRCADGLECDFSENPSCGIADMAGVCRDPGEVRACPEIYAPVCGCDGQTYSNDCFRAAAGVAFDHDGGCRDPGNGEGEMCGGIAGFQCAEGLRCNYGGVEGCNVADMAGVCVTDEPVICTAEYDPECGCDGRTYSNRCRRVAAGVPLDHPGECAR